MIDEKEHLRLKVEYNRLKTAVNELAILNEIATTISSTTVPRMGSKHRASSCEYGTICSLGVALGRLATVSRFIPQAWFRLSITPLTTRARLTGVDRTTDVLAFPLGDRRGRGISGHQRLFSLRYNKAG